MIDADGNTLTVELVDGQKVVRVVPPAGTETLRQIKVRLRAAAKEVQRINTRIGMLQTRKASIIAMTGELQSLKDELES